MGDIVAFYDLLLKRTVSRSINGKTFRYRETVDCSV